MSDTDARPRSAIAVGRGRISWPPVPPGPMILFDFGVLGHMRLPIAA